MEETKIEAIYSTLQLMNKNAIIEFLIKVDSLNYEEINDKTILLKYMDMALNYTKICKQMNLDKNLQDQLYKFKVKTIQHLNEWGDQLQEL